MADHGLLAVDVGSSCVKLGWFPSGGDCASKATTHGLTIAPPPLPAPQEVFQVEHRERPPAAWAAELETWLDDVGLPPAADCAIGSVHRGAADALDALLARRRWGRVLHLSARDLPLEVRVAEPQRVGIDRLLGALAANRLRRANGPAIVVDMGTAATVDLIAADGGFEGGAILAGPTLALVALHTGTASLPLLAAGVLETPPAPVGKSTAEAMAAGAYWGAVGAVRELIGRIATQLSSAPEVYLTGGAAQGFVVELQQAPWPVRHVPHLVLSGIRLAAVQLPPS